MSASQRRKGLGAERELARVLSDFIGPVHRTLGQERDSGPDLIAGRWRIEVKRRKKIALLYEALERARTQSSPMSSAAVAVRADAREWLIVMPVTDFVRIAREELIEPSTSP